MTSKNKRIPKLRFPEFSGEWEEKVFGEVYSFHTTNSLSRTELNYDNGSVKNIHYGDIHTKFKSNFDINKEVVPFINNTVEINKISDDSYCKEGDIVIADASEDYKDIGKTIEIINLDGQKLVAGLHTYIARPIIDMAIGFSGYMMQTYGVRLQIMRFANGISVLGISKGNISSVSLNIPAKPEQQKIASFLTAVDELIAKLQEEKSLWEEYKKGAMQQIFEQKIRFTDENGNHYPAWEEKKLESFALFYRGGSLSKSDIELNGILECVHYGELFTIYNETIKTVKSKTNVTNGFISKFGDILMPSSDVTPSGLATASCILKDGVVLGGDINIVRVENDISPIFISYLLNFKKSKIIELVSGTTVKHIYIKDIKNILLSIPSSKPEQQKIADFLSAIDAKIEAVAEQIEQAGAYKKALLQQMFV